MKGGASQKDLLFKIVYINHVVRMGLQLLVMVGATAYINIYLFIFIYILIYTLL